MLYVQLDTNWPDHPKVIDAGMDGAGLHAVTLCLAKRLEADGWVNRRQLYRQGATDELIGRLVDLRLLEVDGDRVRPHGWLDRNPSQAAIVARRASKAEAARRGNHAKWKHPTPFDDCPICNPKPQVIAPCDRTDSHNGEPAIATDRTPTKQKPKSEVTPAIAPSEPDSQIGSALVDKVTHLRTVHSANYPRTEAPACPTPQAAERCAPASPLATPQTKDATTGTDAA